MSRRNKLSEHSVKFFYHAKRIHEFNEKGFDYLEDISCYLDEPQGKDHECSTLVEVAEKTVARP